MAAAGGSPYDAFREGLRELGYVEAKNIILELRFAGGFARLAELAADLVRLQSDIIVTDGGVASVRAVLSATGSYARRRPVGSRERAASGSGG